MDVSLVFEFIEISGFMSFPPNQVQRLDLNTNRLTTIIGENLDVGDGERNGCGKSATIDALLYLYFGRSPRISNQGFVNYIEPGPLLVGGEARRAGIAFRVERGEAPSLLRLFEKPAMDERDFRHKEGSKFIFETTKSTKPETSKRIVELLGFDLKLSEVLLSNSDRSCFFLKTEEEQRNIVERIFGFTVFTEKADRLRELRKEENKNLLTKESALIATKQANDRVLARIVDLEEKSNIWAIERDKLVKFLIQQINTYDNIEFEHENTVLAQYHKICDQVEHVKFEIKTHKQSLSAVTQKHDIWRTQQNKLITEITEHISKMKSTNAAAEIETIKLRLQLEQNLHTLKNEINAAQRERIPYQESLQSNHTERSRLVKKAAITEQQIIQLNETRCPTCGQDWADTRDHVLKAITELDTEHEEVKRLDILLDTLKKKIRKIDHAIDEMQMHFSGLTEQRHALPETIFTTIEEATRASSNLDDYIQKLAEAQQLKNPHGDILNHIVAQITAGQETYARLQQQIHALPATKYDTLQAVTAAHQSLQNLRQQLLDLRQNTNPHRETIDQLRAKALMPVDESEITALRRNIEHMTFLISLMADRDSPIRKAILNDWLPELNQHVNNYLESLELTHRVVFDSDMTASFIISDGKQCGFGNLSTGQRLRVWLATNLGFRDIFELINYKINLFFVDEVLDRGMSQRGAEVSYRVLDQLVKRKRSLFLITHRSELVDMADHTLTITLENGLSTIQ